MAIASLSVIYALVSIIVYKALIFYIYIYYTYIEDLIFWKRSIFESVLLNITLTLYLVK